MVMVIIAGHIDLSVGSVAAFVGIVVATAMVSWHFPPLLAFVLGIVLGAAIGAWQGWWVAYIGVPAFIVTLAGMLIFRGANQFFGNSNTVTVPDSFTFIGGGSIPDFGPNTNYSNGTLILGALVIVALVWQEFRQRRTQTLMGAEPAPLWVSIVKILVLVLVAGGATYLFATGRIGTSYPVSAVGGNWHAAELSGVKIKRINFFVMMNMSVLASVAGMVGVARAGASGPGDGTGWELDAIAAVFIGGAAVAGGIGTVVGSIVGGLVIAILNNGLQLLGVSNDRVQIIKGLVLLLAVGVDVYSKRQGRPSLIGMFARGPKSTSGGDTPTSAPIDRPSVAPAGESAEASSRPQSTTPNA